MRYESETTMLQTDSLSKDMVRDWISICKVSGEKSRFVKTQIGKALEYKDPIALKFLRTAHEIDPKFIEEGSFNTFMNLLKSQ